MAEIKDLSTTDASNNGTAANAGFPENMPAANVNNAARALEGMIARWYADGNGTLTTGGASNAYTLTPNRTISAYTDGDVFLFEANHTNDGAATLNVSALGAKSILLNDGAALIGNEILSGGRYLVTYDGTQFLLVNPSTYLGNTLNLTIADDDVAVISFNASSARGLVAISSTISASAHGIAAFRCSDFVFCTELAGNSVFDVTTGALTGTTGTDGSVTVSPHTDGKLYIENRNGGSRGFGVTFYAMQNNRRPISVA